MLLLCLVVEVISPVVHNMYAAHFSSLTQTSRWFTRSLPSLSCRAPCGSTPPLVADTTVCDANGSAGLLTSIRGKLQPNFCPGVFIQKGRPLRSCRDGIICSPCGRACRCWPRKLHASSRNERSFCMKSASVGPMVCKGPMPQLLP